MVLLLRIVRYRQIYVLGLSDLTRTIKNDTSVMCCTGFLSQFGQRRIRTNGSSDSRRVRPRSRSGGNMRLKVILSLFSECVFDQQNNIFKVMLYLCFTCHIAVLPVNIRDRSG
jgi:hypothetical protein